MAGQVVCRNCGRIVPAGDRFCGQCGLRAFPPNDSGPLGPRVWATPFQIDPLWPPPRRDARYVMIVVGIALTVLAILFLGVSAIVSGAVSSSCGGAPCTGPDPGPWFLWFALPFLLLGVGLLVVGVMWGLRPWSPGR